MKGLKFLITLFLGTSLSPISALAQYSELAARDNPQAQQRALVLRVEKQESRLISLERELHALRAQVVQQGRAATVTVPAVYSPAPAPASQQPLAATGSTRTYTVHSGDTLNSVARQHSVSVMELMAINNLRAPDSIQIGRELLIPTLQPAAPAPAAPSPNAAAAPATPANTRAYTVRSGDTIAAIAKAHGITIQDIATANGMANANVIAIGQQLVIPQPVAATPKVLAKTTIPASQPAAAPKAPEPAPTPEATADNPFPTGYAYYTVVAKDNLYTIGKLFGTTQKELEELNGLEPNATIHPNQQLVVPMANYKGPFVQN